MNDIQDIRLEFLRHGPAHNQLLSPLTPYLALCGADGPVSVHLPFEHRQLLTRLSRLRYEVDGVTIATSQREAELHELGETIARVLAQIPALVSELRAARKDTNRLVNIQLKVSAYELGLVPFEATMAPSDSSGSGAPLLLRTLTGMTREIRRGEPLALDWNRAPKILFAFASPPGLPAVPAQAHLEALRRAIEPWVEIKSSPEARLPEVRKLLTLLPNATLRGISDACQAQDYTHVHILAHGATLPGSDNRRFGVVLHQEGDATAQVVVDGERLALALKSMSTNGQGKPPPSVVTLATCDSGNAGSVLTPGGSIAHELHAQDIPWVIASQFPLWMRASNIAVEILYRGLLEGNDPRWVLHELRQRLRMDLPDTHDWASIVAYAAIAPDLEQQVASFRTRQTKRKMEVKFARIDELVRGPRSPDAGPAPRDVQELEALCATIRADLAAWSGEARPSDRPERAERIGMQAAAEKRIAIAYWLHDQASPHIRDAYERSRQFYEAALIIEPTNHWVMTQFLSIAASPLLAPDDAQLAQLTKYRDWWRTARQLASWQLDDPDRSERVWAHGTLAELELLGTVYGEGAFATGEAAASQRAAALAAALKAIDEQCRRIRDLAGPGAFEVMSTQRQFRRYLDQWPRERWNDLAKAALAALRGE